MSNKDDLDYFISNFINTKVRNKFDIVELNKDYQALYHISTFKQKELIPNVSRRSLYTEDNTIPRISTSTNIVGCLFGYASAMGDLGNLFYNPYHDQEKNDYKGGYYLHVLKPSLAIKPHKKLLPDQYVSDEHWLVNYNKDTLTYKPEYISKILLFSGGYFVDKDKLLKTNLTFYIEAKEKTNLTTKIILDPGYYKIDLVYQEIDKNTHYNYKIKNLTYSNISKTDFESLRKTYTALENMEHIMDENKDEIKEYVKHINPDILDKIKIVKLTDLDIPYVYHISKVKRDYFTPNVTTRLLPGEDNTIPRICVSNSLVDCMKGYLNITDEILNTDVNIDKENPYKGGFYVYCFQPEYVFIPNEELVPGVKTSNEIWMLPYSEEYQTFKPISYCELIPDKITTVPRANRTVFHLLYFYINVPSEIYMDNKTKFDSGYYWFGVYDITENNEEVIAGNFRLDPRYEKVDQAKYIEEKAFHSALESNGYNILIW